MYTKERIKTIRLSKMIDKNPIYAQRIGVRSVGQTVQRKHVIGAQGKKAKDLS